jgi:hypothetical protein
MNPWVLAYEGMRTLKWLLWASFVGHSLYFMYDRAPHLTPFGHLTDATAFAMFGLSNGGRSGGFSGTHAARQSPSDQNFEPALGDPLARGLDR